MDIIIDLYDLEIDENKLETFFKHFSDQKSTLTFTKFGKEQPSAYKKKKRDEDINNPLSILDIDLEESKYNITAMKTATSIAVMFDRFYSFNVREEDLEEELSKLIAKLHGFEVCEVSGFTAKNRDGKKIQPIEKIYFKNSEGIKFPKKMSYSKKSKEINKELEIKCFSPVISSILNSTEMCFENQNDFYILRSISVASVVGSNLRRNEMENKKTEKLKEWLLRNPSHFTTSLIKIYINREKEDFLKRKKSPYFLNYMERFLTVVPFFHDERDKLTDKIMQIYKKALKPVDVEMECDYLKIRNKKYLERKPICSIKEWMLE